MGNGVALFVLNRPVRGGPHGGDFIGSLRWDVVSVGYVAPAVLALLIEYGRDQTGSTAAIAVVFAISTAVIMRTPDLTRRAWQKDPEQSTTSAVPQGWQGEWL